MHGQLAETRQRYQIYVIPAVKTIPAVKQGWITNLQSQYLPVVNTLGSQTKSHFPTRRKISSTVTIPTGPVVKIFYLHVQYPPVVTPFPSPAVKPPHPRLKCSNLWSQSPSWPAVILLNRGNSPLTYGWSVPAHSPTYHGGNASPTCTLPTHSNTALRPVKPLVPWSKYFHRRHSTEPQLTPTPTVTITHLWL